jgi:hypothetical protein
MSSTATDTPPPAPAAPEFPLLYRLVGEPFLFARRSYGDELVFHFGERRADPPRVIKGREYRYEHGSYSLHVRGSAWVVKAAVGISSGVRDWLAKVDNVPPEAVRVEAEASITPGARVTAVIPFPVTRPDVTGFGLRVEISDGATVVIIPTPDNDPEPPPEGVTFEPLADWELHTPYGNLVVGPGRDARNSQQGA